MRGKGESSIYQRASDGRWVASIELPTRDGTRRRKIITNADKSALLKDLTKVKQRLAKTGDLPTASQTVESWLNWWLVNIAAKKLRPKTIANYRSMIKTHVVPVIGTARLDKINGDHIRKVADTINRKGLSSTTALTVHRIMSSAFESAKMEGRIGVNPTEYAEAPLSAPTKLEVLNLQEVGQLVNLFDDGTERLMWTAFMLTGARRGELLGLTWDRVTDVLDLSWQLQRHPEEMIAPANYEYQRLHKGLYLTRPKSKAGWRVVPLVEPLEGFLRVWRQIAPHNDYGLVFATRGGLPIDPDWISKQWPKVLSSAGITKKVRLHDLRHTAVDLLYDAGVPEAVIMEIVGHSTRGTTRAYKSRGNRPQLTDAMKSVSALLGIES